SSDTMYLTLFTTFHDPKSGNNFEITCCQWLLTLYNRLLSRFSSDTMYLTLFTIFNDLKSGNNLESTFCQRCQISICTGYLARKPKKLSLQKVTPQTNPSLTRPRLLF